MMHLMRFQVNMTIGGDPGLEIESAGCDCPKGLGEACSHIAAVLYGISHLKKLGMKVIPTDPVKTSLPQTWHKPRGDKMRPVEVQNVIAQGYNKRRDPMEAPKRALRSTLYNPLRTDLPNMMELHDEQIQVTPDALVLPALRLAHLVPTQPTPFGNFPRGSILAVHQKMNSECIIKLYDGFEYPPLPVSNKMTHNIAMFPLTYENELKLEALRCTEPQIHAYEEQTRLQSQSSLWHALKKDRLSASNMRKVRTRTKNFEKLNLDLRTKTRQTQAMSAGLADEPIAVENYVSVCNNEVNIYPVGIVINPWAFWIAASPDRKVYKPSRSPPIGILEIKCPRVSSVLDTNYLKRVGDNLTLNKNDKYYTQVQTQLAVAGLEWCDFFVWCLNDYHLETIYFDPVEWQNIKDNADLFFFDYYLGSSNIQ